MSQIATLASIYHKPAEGGSIFRSRSHNLSYTLTPLITLLPHSHIPAHAPSHTRPHSLLLFYHTLSCTLPHPLILTHIPSIIPTTTPSYPPSLLSYPPPHPLPSLLSYPLSHHTHHHPPFEAFVVKSVALTAPAEEDLDEVEEEALGEEDGNRPAAGQSYGGSSYGGGGSSGGGDLLDLMDDMGMGSGPSSSTGGAMSSSSSSQVKKVVIVTAETGKGVFISGGMVKINGHPALVLDVGNQGGTPVQALAVQLNKSTFGLAPVNPQLVLPQAVANGSMCSTTFALTINPAMINPQDTTAAVQAAIKNMATNEVFYFARPVAIEAVFVPHAGDPPCPTPRYSPLDYRPPLSHP